LRRLVICGRSGWWSFEAPAWLAGVGASWSHITASGRVIGTGPADLSPDHPKLRAAHAVAHLSPAGLALSRHLILEKLAAQRRLLEARYPDHDAAITTLARVETAADTADTLDHVRRLEAEGAAAYFAAWQSGTTIRFSRRDSDIVPSHWLRFAGRSSTVSGDAQHASDPLNSLLNLAYALLLIETTVAMRSCGLDPGIPLGLHAFERNRASGALDLLEPCRIVADEIVLDLIASTVFGRRDFVEQADGTITLASRVTRALLDAMPRLAQAVAPIVERTAQSLADTADLGVLPTPLTGANRSRGRAPYRRQQRAVRAATPALEQRCNECGVILSIRTRKLCDECRRSLNTERLASFQAAETARRLSTGMHPSSRPAVRAQISERQRAHADARRADEGGGGFTGKPSEFRRLILPRIGGVKPSELARATGLSPGYCAQIRAGHRIPHIRHWAALQLAGLQTIARKVAVESPGAEASPPSPAGPGAAAGTVS
jgi:CRISPR-associated endonuclease Cas1